MRFLMIIAAGFLMTACDLLNKAAVSELPPEVSDACPAPSQLPQRDISQNEIVTLWGDDRDALKLCARKHRAAVDAFNGLKEALE